MACHLTLRAVIPMRFLDFVAQRAGRNSHDMLHPSMDTTSCTAGFAGLEQQLLFSVPYDNNRQVGDAPRQTRELARAVPATLPSGD